MEPKRTQDELLSELWANYQDLSDILLLLETLLKRGEVSGQEETVHRCFGLLRDRVDQYTRDIQKISGILVQKPADPRKRAARSFRDRPFAHKHQTGKFYQLRDCNFYMHPL